MWDWWPRRAWGAEGRGGLRATSLESRLIATWLLDAWGLLLKRVPSARTLETIMASRSSRRSGFCGKLGGTCRTGRAGKPRSTMQLPGP